MSIKFKKIKKKKKVIYFDVWNCFDRRMAGFDEKKIMC